MQKLKTKAITIGSLVTIYDFELGEEITYKIVLTKTGKEEEILIDSPLGKALMGKFSGIHTVEAPDTKYEVRILNVDNTRAGINKKTDDLTKLKQIVNKAKREKAIQEERKQKAKNLSAWYQTHPFQGGGCSGK